MLAGISATWYTFLEQGRDVRPSRQVLDAIARALGLAGAERTHLFAIAVDEPVPTSPDEVLDAEVARVVDLLDPAPTYVTGGTFDLLAWNTAAAELFRGALDHGEHPNLVRWVFLDQDARYVLPDWTDVAQGLLARLRARAGRTRASRFTRNSRTTFVRPARRPTVVAAVRRGRRRRWDQARQAGRRAGATPRVHLVRRCRPTGSDHDDLPPPGYPVTSTHPASGNRSATARSRGRDGVRSTCELSRSRARGPPGLSRCSYHQRDPPSDRRRTRVPTGACAGVGAVALVLDGRFGQCLGSTRDPEPRSCRLSRGANQDGTSPAGRRA